MTNTSIDTINNTISTGVVEIQLSYRIHFSLSESSVNIDENIFGDLICDIIKPSSNSFNSQCGLLDFYSSCAPENFDIENKTINFYVHFVVDEAWYMNTDRNNLLNCFIGLKDVAIVQCFHHFNIKDNIVIITSIKLENVTMPDKDYMGELFDIEPVE